MTQLSTRGQVVLPKALRDRQGWRAGDRLVVEETPDGVLLRAAASFPVSRGEDVFACLRQDRPPVSLEEMNEAVLREARRRDRG